MNDYTDTYFDDFDTENNGLTVVGEEFQYIQLRERCRILLRQVRSHNDDEISRILLRYKRNYETIMGDMVSNEMYNLITQLIEVHETHGDIKDHIKRKIQYYNSIVEEILEAKNEYVDRKALDDVTTTYDNMYNSRRLL